MPAMLIGVIAACGDSEPRSEPAVPATMVDPSYDVTLVQTFGGLQFEAPIEVGAYPGGRLFVAQQPGIVTILPPEGAGANTLLDIRDRVDNEKGEGLLSVALDPAFEANGYVWAYYFTAGTSASVLSRFEVSGDRADPDSELRVLHIEQPGYNQNGGAIRFGNDGMLYLTLGDGSASLDPYDNGQDLSTLLGSVLRLDVSNASAGQPYVVPQDNPFLDTPGARGEIWAYGLRNPWRAAFDPATGALWAGDVGVSEYEEVNRIERGANLGWNLREGPDCLADGDCLGDGLTDPVAVYGHEEGRCSVIGGVFYQGEAVPDLLGKYLFGDFCSGEVLALDAENPRTIERVATGIPQLTSFGTDEAGEIYITTLDGNILKLVRQETP